MPGPVQDPQTNAESSDTADGIAIQSQKRALKFWEINPSFKCPVVGMCLTLDEQKQLLKRIGVAIKAKSPFEIHEILVASADKESRLSRRVDTLLYRKFGKETALLLGLDSNAFKRHVKAAFEAGDCIGATWAAAIHPDLTPELRRELFGDIHMAMHWSGEQRNKLKQKLARQSQEVDKLCQRCNQAVQHRRTLQKENRQLRQHQETMMTTVAMLERQKTGLESELASVGRRCRYAEIERENQVLQEKLAAALAGAEEKNRLLALLEEENRRLSSEIERQQESNRRTQKEAQEILGEVISLNRCESSCPSFDLCQKRVLVVGGITRMASLYRELVESNGGIFEYHDGYMQNGVKNLEGRLRRADVVVCPVNCNSHAACSIVKNLAKKHRKTVHMLANSSLSAVSHALWGASDGGTIN